MPIPFERLPRLADDDDEKTGSLDASAEAGDDDADELEDEEDEALEETARLAPDELSFGFGDPDD